MKWLENKKIRKMSNSNVYLIEDRKQYKQLVKILSQVFETSFEVIGVDDDSKDHTDSNDFDILIKFPQFDRRILIGLGKSGTGYQTIGDGLFVASIEYQGEANVWNGLPIKSLYKLVEDMPRFDCASAGNSEEAEREQLNYFGKLKTELEKLQKADDERKWWDKHSFGF
ncbi:MAG: hypothetical protein LBI13_00100 [Streptococcaceae bacterium]|jgi:hypothetical protein|nr:hypothetical protein [Streptococcaceae bacterium]